MLGHLVVGRYGYHESAPDQGAEGGFFTRLFRVLFRRK